MHHTLIVNSSPFFPHQRGVGQQDADVRPGRPAERRAAGVPEGAQVQVGGGCLVTHLFWCLSLLVF